MTIFSIYIYGENELFLSRFCSRLKGRSRRLEREWPGLDLGFFVVGLGCRGHGIQTPLALVRLLVTCDLSLKMD